MASKEITELDVDDTDLCCIEASVVTGFEECARGEAKEKFNVADVKAVRGKITWKIPVQCVKEVIKMGSIDNCRVVIHSVPHFNFTDQHESLASLQKLVLDFNWDKGLRVWKKFNEFPHPILSTPEVVPTPEDLIDVVIVENRTKTPKSGDKKKKGGRWKKKEQRNSKSKTKDTQEVQDKDEAVSTSRGNDCGAVNDAVNKSETSNTQCDEGSVKSISIDENGTKKVVIKQTDPNQPSPEIEIKVLIPGPNENVFPTDLSEKDQRDLEPMDVDRSMQQIPDDLNDSVSKSRVSDSESSKDEGDEPGSSPQPKSLASPFKQPSAPISILSSAKDFASSLIERLTSSSPQSTMSSDLSSLPNCATPPSTPVQPSLDHFMKMASDQSMKSTSVDVSKDSLVDIRYQKKLVESDLDFSLPVIPSTSVDNDEVSKHTDKNVESLSNVNEKSDISLNIDPTYATDKVMMKEDEAAESKPSSIAPVKKERDPTKPTFRVTCNRVGDNHSFDSSSAAASLGSAIIRYFGWSVDLKNFDIEVLLNIDNEEVTVSLGITKTSLHNRNLVAFGPTTLRATICYNMLRLCRVKNGDFICDPMCGTSAIPIEGSLNWVNCFFFGGDYHEMGIARSLQNIDAIQQKQSLENRGNLKIGTVQWNIEHFPLRDKCVDVFVSDLPFGYRMGSRSNNRTLYPSLLSAMARTARPGARACLLTEDKTSLIKALQAMGKLWQRRLILCINMGGLSGFVFLLTRTTASYSTPSQTWKKEELEFEASPNDNAGSKSKEDVETSKPL